MSHSSTPVIATSLLGIDVARVKSSVIPVTKLRGLLAECCSSDCSASGCEGWEVGVFGVGSPSANARYGSTPAGCRRDA